MNGMQRPDAEAREPNTGGCHLNFPTESHRLHLRTNSMRSGPSKVDGGNNGDDAMDICEGGCEYECKRRNESHDGNTNREQRQTQESNSEIMYNHGRFGRLNSSTGEASRSIVDSASPTLTIRPDASYRIDEISDGDTSPGAAWNVSIFDQ